MRGMRSDIAGLIAATLAATGVAGCSASSSATSTGAGPASPSAAVATASSTPQAASATATPSATPSPTPTATATATLAGCPASRPVSSLPVLARPPISPDDLLALPDGTLWVSDPVSGIVLHLDAGGHTMQRIAFGQAPEGMVALTDGRIVLAEQTPNRLVTFTPPATATTTLLTLPARGGAEGVDGLGQNPASGAILVPDSPHGTLLSVTADGTATRLASGLGRDVGATVGPDGAVWVVVEGSRGLFRVPASGGAAQPVGGLAQLDDVLSDGGLLYATALVAGEVVAIDPRTGADAVLVTGIGADAAQGLAVLADGRIAVADSARGIIATLAPCG